MLEKTILTIEEEHTNTSPYDRILQFDRRREALEAAKEEVSRDPSTEATHGRVNKVTISGIKGRPAIVLTNPQHNNP